MLNNEYKIISRGCICIYYKYLLYSSFLSGKKWNKICIAFLWLTFVILIQQCKTYFEHYVLDEI